MSEATQNEVSEDASLCGYIKKEVAMRTMLKGKIHRARVTMVDINYEGSITIDKELMEAADILPYEMVHVLDINNGERFQTYAIEGERGSGVIGINGAAARLAAPGDTVIILNYCTLTEEEAHHLEPALVYVNDRNVIVAVKGTKWIAECGRLSAALSN